MVLSVLRSNGGSLQAHLSYNIKPTMWAALDATYYTGGNSTLNNQIQKNKLSNVRLGSTVAVPASKRSSLKLSFSTGAYVVAGSNFKTIAINWAYS